MNNVCYVKVTPSVPFRNKGMPYGFLVKRFMRCITYYRLRKYPKAYKSKQLRQIIKHEQEKLLETFRTKSKGNMCNIRV